MRRLIFNTIEWRRVWLRSITIYCLFNLGIQIKFEYFSIRFSLLMHFVIYGRWWYFLFLAYKFTFLRLNYRISRLFRILNHLWEVKNFNLSLFWFFLDRIGNLLSLKKWVLSKSPRLMYSASCFMRYFKLSINILILIFHLFLLDTFIFFRSGVWRLKYLYLKIIVVLK
jgi:hypothetical protein